MASTGQFLVIHCMQAHNMAVEYGYDRADLFCLAHGIRKPIGQAEDKESQREQYAWYFV